jgi:two-component system sensor histidine kinase DesK
VQVVTFGVLLVSVRRLLELVQKLEAARDRVAALAVSEERLRLPCDLHDRLGHNLSVIVLKSELARRLLRAGEPSAAAREVGTSRRSPAPRCGRPARRSKGCAVSAFRTSSTRLQMRCRPPAWRWKSASTACRRAIAKPPLAFAVREATTNVIRHSRARRCQIAVRRTALAAEVEVRDDGVGPSSRGGEGSGLRGLAERLAPLGGSVDAGPAPGGGFRLLARVPLPQDEPAAGCREATAAG